MIQQLYFWMCGVLTLGRGFGNILVNSLVLQTKRERDSYSQRGGRAGCGAQFQAGVLEWGAIAFSALSLLEDVRQNCKKSEQIWPYRKRKRN